MWILKCSSLYYVSRRSDTAPLEAEFALRLKHGFDVEWLTSEVIKKRYVSKALAAILSKLAAHVDP